MVSFQQVREADPSIYADLADRWERLASELEHTGEDIKRTVSTIDGWHGAGADAAFAHFHDVRSGYEDAAEHVERIPRVLRTLSNEITAA